MHRPVPFVLLVAASIAGCSAPASTGANPPAPGFLAEASDPAAIEVADAVMNRLGGRRAWDDTRYLRWTFFGARTHVWDRRTGLVRIEGTTREDGRPYVIIMDLDDGAGRAWRDGRELPEGDALQRLLELGRSAWINDSYWLIMPYKLKDTGVRLRHLGERDMNDGRRAEVLELTFRDVGETPENKYHVYVAAVTGLVEQWDFYRDADDAAPTFQTPWRGWSRFGSILLSGDRGERAITDIAVLESVPGGVFTSPAPVRWPRHFDSAAATGDR